MTKQKTIPWWTAGIAAVLAVLAVGAAVGVELATTDEVVVAPAGVPSHTASSGIELPPKRNRGGDTYSNIYKYDYVGPDACRECHAEQYQLWRGHPHSRMNDNANAQSVVGDFSGGELSYGGGKVVFDKVDGDYVMDLFKDGAQVRRLRVTRTVGSRYVQMYVGVQTHGPEPSSDALYSEERKLPFAYAILRKHWFPQTYDEAPDATEYTAEGRLTDYYAFYDEPQGGVWKRTCIVCHNTYPYAARLGPVGQGVVAGFPSEDLSLDSKPTVTNRDGAPVIEDYQLVTLGISCESCHFGAREHALQDRTIRFLPKSPLLSFAKATDELAKSARDSAYVINSICAQCHDAKTQGPMYPNGGASWNSREAGDLRAGACTNAVKCTDCHNPHQASATPADTLSAAKDDPVHIAACTGCHRQLATKKAAAEHSHHASEHGVTCLDCHMPRMVHGLSDMVRSHRISSPGDPAMIGAGWPNACNLCHLDRSVTWTVEELKATWGATIALPADAKLPAGPAGEAWLGDSKPMVRKIAADAYSRSPLGKAALARVLPILADQSPPNRMFGLVAVERILGRPLPLDTYTPWASPAERDAQIARLRTQ